MALPLRPDRSPPPEPGSDGRVLSDDERLAALERLREATAEGRLGLDELSDRLDTVLAARTRAELAPAVDDLPPAWPVPPAAPLPASAPVSSGRPPRGRRRRVVAVMGGSDRKGRWQLHRRTTAFALLGGVTLDLRSAAIEDGEVDIRCWAFLGGVDVIVPEGVPVDFGGFVLVGGRDEKIADVPVAAGAPTVRVRGYGVCGSVDLTSKPAPLADRPLVDEVRLRLRRTLDRVLPAPPPAPGHDSTSTVPGTVAVLVATTRPARSRRRRAERAAEDLVRRLASELTARHGAAEAWAADGRLTATFGSARTALRAASALRSTASDVADLVGLLVGVHAGEVEERPDDLAGLVAVAAELAGRACPGEVLVSGVTAELAQGAAGLRFGPARGGAPAGGLAPARALLP